MMTVIFRNVVLLLFVSFFWAFFVPPLMALTTDDCTALNSDRLPNSLPYPVTLQTAREQCYSIDIDSNATRIEMRLNSISGGDPFLYTMFGQLPDRPDVHDCRSAKTGQRDEFCSHDDPQEGTWYVLLYALRATQGVFEVIVSQDCSAPDRAPYIRYPSTDDDGTFDISWNDSSTLHWYTLERSKSDRFTQTTWLTTLAPGFPPNYRQSGLTSGSYYYRVRSQNSCGASEWVEGDKITISDCSYAISPERTTVSPTGGSGRIALTTTQQCSWTAQSDSSWVTITGNSAGTGSGEVVYKVGKNPSGDERTATIRIESARHTIVQKGLRVIAPPISLLLKSD